jgi:hypothetical protein
VSIRDDVGPDRFGTPSRSLRSTSMVLDLGPCPAEDALSWSKFARRIVVELRSSPDVEGTVPTGLLDSWATTIDRWSVVAARCVEAGQPFRWVSDVEPEMAEFLLAGLDRSLHSDTVRELCTEDEIARQRPFTVLVVRSFVDGLLSEGEGCQQYADQVMTSLQGLLPD